MQPPVGRSQVLIVESKDADTIQRPSGEKSIAVILLECPNSCLTTLCVAESTTTMERSSKAKATRSEPLCNTGDSLFVQLVIFAKFSTLQVIHSNATIAGSNKGKVSALSDVHGLDNATIDCIQNVFTNLFVSRVPCTCKRFVLVRSHNIGPISFSGVLLSYHGDWREFVLER
ncbi:hypothetical protein OGATHE_003818 [Ogataea polymorpha]|uniref:Uncharacterized protein n=1 Tax=Ogataea polymorpha TaxID=460523 RepID=A0A9P8P376_9ASCO|nr:hypothetical protein OGATHE_003818 [Ogataea polymorpha]